MAIPEGYRLLRSADVGKVIGVDFDYTIYFDNEVRPGTIKNTYLTNFIYAKYDSRMGNTFLYVDYDDVYHTIYNTQGNGGPSVWWKASHYTFKTNIDITSFNNGDEWNNWLYVKDLQNPTPKALFISDMNSLGKSITDKAGASGKKSITELKDLVDNLKTTFTGQEKTVTPSKTSQVITPDSGYDGLSKVTVNVIPSSYIIPSGTLTISENGTKDVTQYASVNVNVPTPEPTYWDGTYIEEELASGYTLTLNTTKTSHTELYYSLDNGATYTGTGTSEFNITLENVNQIKFKAGAGYYYLVIIDGNSELIAQMIHGSEVEFENITITKDITLTVTYGPYGGGTGD